MVRLARSTGLDCVSMEGEKGSSKGVLSGGYINEERSKMAAFAKYGKSRSELE